MSGPSVISLFTGAGGLDLGFEHAGFRHLESVELDPWAVDTVRKNRPQWSARELDVRHYEPDAGLRTDVLIAGPPCQGFSLGGHRYADDARNGLFREVVRVAAATRPEVVLIENVLNLRTMSDPATDRPFVETIAHELGALGYEVDFRHFRVSGFGVPQTRRRFVFVGVRRRPGRKPFTFPVPSPRDEKARPWIGNLSEGGDRAGLTLHEPDWSFRSRVHRSAGIPPDPEAPVVPFRISRTASDGHPVRSLDAPFPAIDTATVWGWAQGDITAARVPKDRTAGPFVRSPGSTVPLWRVNATSMRTFTPREYARLQTFPDDWVFLGANKRDIHKQIGNAVPVEFARHLALAVRAFLDGRDPHR